MIFITCDQMPPATEFAPCHHFAQRWQCDSQKARNTTRLKCCAGHAKWHRRSSKCCACHEKSDASSENVAKVLRLPHKTTFYTFWNMLECHAKWHACHAERHYNLLWNIRQGKVLQLTKETSDSRWDMLEHQASISCETSSNFTLRSVKINVSLRVFLCTYCKIDVSCEASVDFHDMSAPCHHFAQRWQFDLPKTRNTTRLKCCAGHATWHRRSSKCCGCHEKSDASSENVAKVLRLPHKTTFDTSWNMLECHEAPRLPQNGMTTSSDTLNSPVFATFPIGAAPLRPWRPQTDGCEQLRTVANGYERLRTVANGCERLRTVANGCERLRTPDAGSREHGSPPGPPNVKREPFATHSGNMPGHGNKLHTTSCSVFLHECILLLHTEAYFVSN